MTSRSLEESNRFDSKGADGRRQIDLTPLTPVLDFEFEPEVYICRECCGPIAAGDPFRTIAPSKVRFHPECVKKQAIGSNMGPQGLPGQSRFRKWP